MTFAIFTFAHCNALLHSTVSFVILLGFQFITEADSALAEFGINAVNMFFAIVAMALPDALLHGAVDGVIFLR